MNLLPRRTTPAAARILLGRALRAFGDGYIAVLLGVYLPALVILLRRDNRGNVPAPIERVAAHLPSWLRGTREGSK